MEIKVMLHPRAKNVEQIRAFWAAVSENERNRSLASVDFLHDTGRMDDREYANHISNMDKYVTIAQVDSRARRARLEDGDQTLHSQLRGAEHAT